MPILIMSTIVGGIAGSFVRARRQRIGLGLLSSVALLVPMVALYFTLTFTSALKQPITDILLSALMFVGIFGTVPLLVSFFIGFALMPVSRKASSEERERDAAP